MWNDPKLQQAIADARDKGDLSENAEYDAAKEAQGLLELKISKLEETLANARLIDESQLDTSKGIGAFNGQAEESAEWYGGDLYFW